MTARELPVPALADRERSERISAFVREHYAFTWRCLRRFGLSPADADDAAQRVFVIAAGRYDTILSGSEKAFLFRTAMHTAAKLRRSAGRRPEVLDGAAAEGCTDAPLSDELVDQRRARELLDQILSELPAELAAVLVLFEIEGLSTTQVADALEIPPGTVASRLRRARQELEQRALRQLGQTRKQGAMR